MLQVFGVAETDEFGNEAPDGGVLIVGIKFTMWASPVERAYEGFIPWGWTILTTGPQDTEKMVAYNNDSTFVPEDELTVKGVLMTAREAAKQLAFTATSARQEAMNLETQRIDVDETQARLNMRSYESVMHAEEIAEFAEFVEAYLWYQRWLVGYV